MPKIQSLDELTMGVEEEFQIVDPGSRELRPRARRILDEAESAVGDAVTNELYLSQIEIGTPVCRTLAEVRDQVTRLRKAVIDAAAAHGSRIAAAGTHPFSRFDHQPLTPKPRYRGIAEDFQQLAREQVIFGCHVHVGIDDREEAIAAMNRARPWLPAILALSANSPFWLGDDTGFASYRTALFGRFPTTGIPHPFATRAEYDGVVAALVEVRLIEDASKLYWDMRPSSHFETLEFRIADVCATIDEAVMVAGLCRGLVRASLEAHRRGDPIAEVRPEVLVAAKFRASRFGLEGDLIDPIARRAIPAAEEIGRLLDFLRPSLEANGDREEIERLVRRVIEGGTGAARQREAFARGDRLEDVVDRIVEETARGTD